MNDAGGGRRGCVAATVGGLAGAAVGAQVGWVLWPSMMAEGDPSLGAANLALGLAVMWLTLVVAVVGGALVGVGVALRMAGHRRIVATVAATAALVVPVGVLLAYLAAPAPLAGALLAGVPAAARGLVVRRTQPGTGQGRPTVRPTEERT